MKPEQERILKEVLEKAQPPESAGWEEDQRTITIKELKKILNNNS